jgi:hypothetical protein
LAPDASGEVILFMIAFGKILWGVDLSEMGNDRGGAGG